MPFHRSAKDTAAQIWRMGPLPIILVTAGVGAAAGGAAAFALGAAGPILGMTALMSGSALGSLAAAAIAGRAKATAEARFETLAGEMILIRQRQAEYDQKLVEVEHRAQESPALVWRAATSDIQVLSSLVSDLAKTVAEHDAKLAAPAEAAPAEAQESRPAAEREFVLPRTSPPPRSWFEDETELASEPDVAAELRPVLDKFQPDAPASSAALVAELKSMLATALSGDRLEICLQPYVALPQRRVAGYEATIALKAGEGVPRDAASLAAAARAAGMTAELDRLLIERAGQVMRVLRARDRVVAMTCAISGVSLLDPGFRSAVEAVARAEGKLAENILLSIPADEAPALLANGRDALESLRRSGVGLGVRARAAVGLDLALLEKLKARELRLPAAALISHGSADIHPADVSEMLDRRNIQLLVTEIEDETVMRDLLDCAAALGQGSLFGPSRPVRPEILQPRPVAEKRAAARVEAAKAVARPEPPKGNRQSFRSLLRRA